MIEDNEHNSKTKNYMKHKLKELKKQITQQQRLETSMAKLLLVTQVWFYSVTNIVLSIFRAIYLW